MMGIADTGFLVAYSNRNDFYHTWAKALAYNIHEPLLTCEAVLAETAFLLNNSEIVFRMLDAGLVRLSFDVETHRPNLSELAKRYEDRQPDLADLCLVRMSELSPKHLVITVDGDFLVYRRNRREMIPVLMPPDLKIKR